ncbi:hypothetical protein Tco_1276818 [Tanacetum coccineum]
MLIIYHLHQQLKCPILPHIPNQAHSKPKQRSQCKRQKRIRGRSTSKSSAHKFREYDQKMEALTNFNGFEAFEKVFQANVLTETKKLLHTHIPKAVANYVRPHLNTSVLYKDKIRIADLEGAGLETLKQQYKIDVELECHVDQLKATVLTEANYADLPRLSLNDVEDMYLLQVQDKLHHLLLRFVRDFNNALLLFIKRVMIQNRVEDIQLGVESYQQTLNLTVEVSNHLTNEHKKI